MLLTYPIVLSLYLSNVFVTNRSTSELFPTPVSPRRTTFTCGRQSGSGMSQARIALLSRSVLRTACPCHAVGIYESSSLHATATSASAGVPAIPRTHLACIRGRVHRVRRLTFMVVSVVDVAVSSKATKVGVERRRRVRLQYQILKATGSFSRPTNPPLTTTKPVQQWQVPRRELRH